jgi:hypothetical protein
MIARTVNNPIELVDACIEMLMFHKMNMIQTYAENTSKKKNGKETGEKKQRRKNKKTTVSSAKKRGRPGRKPGPKPAI